MNRNAVIALSVDVKADPTELFCKDFDLGCFDVQNPRRCKSGQYVVIGEIGCYSLPLTGMCPMCDRLK